MMRLGAPMWPLHRPTGRRPGAPCSPPTPIQRQPRSRDLGGRRRCRATTAPTMRWARCSTMCCSIRPSSARKPSSRWRWRATTPMWSSAAWGGSNFAGIALPFMRETLAGEGEDPLRRRRTHRLPLADQGRLHLRLWRCRPYDAVGQDVHARPRLHAARHPRRRPALPRHGAVISHAYRPALMEAIACAADRGLRGRSAVRAERGHLAAPESAHAILRPSTRPSPPRTRSTTKTILFNLTGHGYLDLGAYEQFLAGKLEDYGHPEEDIKAAMEHVPSAWSTRFAGAGGRGAEAPPARFLVPSRRAAGDRVARRSRMSPTYADHYRGGHARPEALPRGPDRRPHPRRGLAARTAIAPADRPFDPAHRVRRSGGHHRPADAGPGLPRPGRRAPTRTAAPAPGSPSSLPAMDSRPTSTPSRRPSTADPSR